MQNPFNDPILIDFIERRKRASESKIETLYRLLGLVRNKKNTTAVFTDSYFKSLIPKFKTTRLISKDLKNFDPNISIEQLMEFLSDPEFTKRSANRKYILFLYYLYNYNPEAFEDGIESLESVKRKRIYISRDFDQILKSGSSITVDEIANTKIYAITSINMEHKSEVLLHLTFTAGIPSEIGVTLCSHLSIKNIP